MSNANDTTLGVATDDVQIGVRLMLNAIVSELDADDRARLEGAAIALGGILHFEGPAAADVIAAAFAECDFRTSAGARTLEAIAAGRAASSSSAPELEAEAEHEFGSIDERNAFMDSHFPERVGDEVPGLFHIPDGRTVAVFLRRVWVYAPAPAAAPAELERDSLELGRAAVAAGAPDGGNTYREAAADAIANILEAVATESGEALEALHEAEQRYRAARPYALSAAVRDSVAELVNHVMTDVERDYCEQLPEDRAGHVGEALERIHKWLISKEGQQR